MSRDASGLTQVGVYAFVARIASIMSYFIFLVWALVPDTHLLAMGITYFPSKYCALAIPAYLIVCAILIVVTYIGINLIHTPDPEEMITLKTPNADLAPSHYVKCGRKEGIPHIGEMDHVQRSYFIATNGGRRRHTYE